MKKERLCRRKRQSAVIFPQSQTDDLLGNLMAAANPIELFSQDLLFRNKELYNRTPRRSLSLHFRDFNCQGTKVKRREGETYTE